MQGEFFYDTNTGSRSLTQEGLVERLGYVPFDPSGVTNVLGISRLVELGFGVRYDHQNDKFTVSDPTGATELEFHQSNGLYIFELAAHLWERTQLQTQLQETIARIDAGHFMTRTGSGRAHEEHFTYFGNNDEVFDPDDEAEAFVTLPLLQFKRDVLQDEIAIVETKLGFFSPDTLGENGGRGAADGSAAG